MLKKLTTLVDSGISGELENNKKEREFDNLLSDVVEDFLIHPPSLPFSSEL